MQDYRLKSGRIEKAVTDSYQKVENTVVDTYKKLESSVVGTYKKVEDAFTSRFLEHKHTDGTE